MTNQRGRTGENHHQWQRESDDQSDFDQSEGGKSDDQPDDNQSEEGKLRPTRC